MHNFEENYASPLCCCEFIDQNGERNHILACCCNCQELDQCCDRLVSCRRIRSKDIKGIMGTCLDRMRCPGRGGAFSILSVSYSMIAPFVLQPLIAIISVLYFRHVAAIMIFCVILKAVTVNYMAKNSARSQIVHYWTVSSIVYSIYMYESSVQPLLEIRWDENLIVVLLTLLALGCIYLTKIYSGRNGASDNHNGAIIGNGIVVDSVCTTCRVKVHPRSVHCTICQNCIPRYDHHCFWLNCCIGEQNQIYFVLGIIFGMSALVYGSLLILTTICRPVFKYGVLVPSDCSDVTDGLELGLCYCCGVYCLGLATLLLLQLVNHVWLVSRGLSGAEWRQHGYSLCTPSPHSRGCFRNWIHFFRGFRKSRN